MEFTCCECLNKYNQDSGDVEERLCENCLNEDVLFNAMKHYVRHLRETGEIDDVWNSLSKETQNAIKVLITTMGREMGELNE